MKNLIIPSIRWLFLSSLDHKLDTILIYKEWVELFIRVRLNFLLLLALIATISAIPVNQIVISEHHFEILILDSIFTGMILTIFFINRSPVGEKIPRNMIFLAIR